MAKLTRQDRRVRRRRILKTAVQLGRDMFPEDEEARRNWLISFIVNNVDIPGIGEAMERRIVTLVCELLEDLIDGD